MEVSAMPYTLEIYALGKEQQYPLKKLLGELQIRCSCCGGEASVLTLLV
jgi:hypothetical protein